MTTWLSALRTMQQQAIPAVLVTVAQVQGSTPRAAGARMLLTGTAQFDTIGGGHLEWRAAQIARSMLEGDMKLLTSQRRLERIALGPGLGQCCGGVVWLCFEQVGSDAMEIKQWHAFDVAWRAGQDRWRVVPLDHAGQQQLLDNMGQACAPGPLAAEPPAELPLHSGQTQLIRDHQGRRWLLDLCRAHQPQVVLFGAGHVGAAIVRVLSTLPCRILWVDEREDMFPYPLPAQVSIEATDVPDAVVDMAEPGAYYLVMTHSHALDQQLTERILKREDVAWFGLIGSMTKRRQFEHRLAERGLGPRQLERITCPIGIPGIGGKEPASIAIAVAAQLMQLWERRLSRPQDQEYAPAMATHVLDGRG